MKEFFGIPPSAEFFRRNALTETTFTDGEFGTIYHSFKFNADDDCMAGDDAGNNLIEETDARGHKTTYTVDSDTSRNEEATDRLGNKTAYEYDNSGRTTKVTSKKADGTELAHVSYAYDTFDNMTEIVRGDGMKYALAYNEFHNLESIGIEGKNEKLIKYAYKNGNGRLKQMTYANGHTMKAVYNSIGQMVAEKWFETEAAAASSTATPIAHYKYVYDGDGNIVRSIDISGKKEYNYEYEEGRIVRATEADIQLSGEIVTAKSVVNTVKYYYDTEGKMTKKVITFADHSTHTVYYETPNDNTVVKFEVPDPEDTNKRQLITSHSKNDSFGRKVFDELQLGTGFVSRQFSYTLGAINDTHRENKKIKSTATTQLVSQIILSNGRTLSYEYDEEERITKVIDSAEGETKYTYDALGQLETETANGITTKFKYDNYGNILAKGVVDENGEIAEVTKISYVYGNDTWKDLLTSYNGQAIEYDAQGNPLTYLGHTLTWEKGRQLKSYDGNTYTYNANGIRTSKTINGVKHTYTLDGVKILRETWGNNTLVSLYDNEDSVCGIIYNNTPYYFLKNLQGDIIAITDATGTVVAEYSYDAWGKCTINCDCCGIASINPYRYRGYYYDDEIGLYYLQSRYYNPIVGRFLNLDDPDLLPSKSGAVFVNLFNYCNNSVICFDDSTGHTLIQDVLSIINKAIDALANLLKQYTVGTKQYKKLKDKLKKLKVNKRANKSQIKQVRKRMDESCSNTRLFGSKFAKIAKVLSVLGIVITCLGDALSYTLDMIYILSILAVDALCELISWLLSKGGEILGKLVPGVGFILGWTLGWCIGLIVSAIFTDEMKENTAYDCYDDWRWNDKLSFSKRIKSLFGTFWNGVWNYGVKAVF